MTLNLVENWKHAWRWGSMWMHVIGTTIGGFLIMAPAMPAEIQELLPAKYRAMLIAAWAVAGIYVRLRKGKADGQQS